MNFRALVQRSAVALLLVGGLIGSTTNPTSAQEQNGNDCADFALFGLRGSGAGFDEGRGHGRRVAAVWDQLAGENGDYTVAEFPINYPATGANNPFNYLSNAFFTSADNGFDLLDSEIALQRVVCPEQRIVLGGYSQGAMVVNRWLQEADDLSDVAAVVLLSDPSRLDEAEYNVGNPSGDGIATFGGPITPAKYAQGLLPEQLWDRTFSFCKGKDPVCTGAPITFIGRHTDAVYETTFPERAAERTHKLLRRYVPSSADLDQQITVPYGEAINRRLFPFGAAVNVSAVDTFNKLLPSGLRVTSNGWLRGTTYDQTFQFPIESVYDWSERDGTLTGQLRLRVRVQGDPQPFGEIGDASVSLLEFNSTSTKTAHVAQIGNSFNPVVAITDLTTESTTTILNPETGQEVQASRFSWCGPETIALSTSEPLLPVDTDTASDIYLYDLATGTFSLIPNPESSEPAPGPRVGPERPVRAASFGDPDCSRNGRFVAFSNDSGAWRYDTRRDRTVSLTDGALNAFYGDTLPEGAAVQIQGALLSPNGQRAAFRADVFSFTEEDEREISFWSNIQTGEVQIITGPNDPTNVLIEAFSRNGILLYTAPDSNGDSRIWYRDETIGNLPIGLPHLNVAPGSVNASGRWYTYATNGFGEVWLGDWNRGFSAIKVAEALGNGGVIGPAISLDGRYLTWAATPDQRFRYEEFFFLNAARNSTAPRYFEPESDDGLNNGGGNDGDPVL